MGGMKKSGRKKPGLKKAGIKKTWISDFVLQELGCYINFDNLMEAIAILASSIVLFIILYQSCVYFTAARQGYYWVTFRCLCTSWIPYAAFLVSLLHLISVIPILFANRIRRSLIKHGYRLPTPHCQKVLPLRIYWREALTNCIVVVCIAMLLGFLLPLFTSSDWCDAD